MLLTHDRRRREIIVRQSNMEYILWSMSSIWDWVWLVANTSSYRHCYRDIFLLAPPGGPGMACFRSDAFCHPQICWKVWALEQSSWGYNYVDKAACGVTNCARSQQANGCPLIVKKVLFFSASTDTAYSTSQYRLFAYDFHRHHGGDTRWWGAKMQKFQVHLHSDEIFTHICEVWVGSSYTGAVQPGFPE